MSEENEVHVEVWGTGKPLREFLWSEEMAGACVFIMENIDFKDTISVVKAVPGPEEETLEIRNTHINIGTGKEISIKELAQLIKEHLSFKGKLKFNTTLPDGRMHKRTDPSKLHQLGWKHKIEVEEGISMLYKWYLNNSK